MSRPRSGGPGVQGGGAPRSREGGSLGAERAAGAELWMCAPGLMRVPPPPPRPRHTRFPADTPSHGVPLERSETAALPPCGPRGKRFQTLAEAGSPAFPCRTRHPRVGWKRVTAAGGLQQGVYSGARRRGDQCSPRPHPDGGLPGNVGPPQPGGGGPAGACGPHAGARQRAHRPHASGRSGRSGRPPRG